MVCYGFCKIALVQVLVLLSSLAWGQEFASTCSSYKYKKSTAAHRQEILYEVKSTILRDLAVANRSLTDFYQELVNCDDLSCQKFLTAFLIRTREQAKLAKFAKAIASRGPGIFSYSRSPRSLREFVQRKENGTLNINHIINFDIPGFTFTDNEKAEAFERWWKVFIPIGHDMGEKANVRDVFEKTQKFFAQANKSLMEMNPMLSFVNEKDLVSVKVFVKVFKKMIDFNLSFQSYFENYRTSHSTTFFSYFNNLFTKDHEMGLVSFEKQAMALIETTTTQQDVNEMCSAWKDLKKQKNLRVKASIGVGFAEAVLCGVGTLSIVGTGPAIALCSLSFADSFVGAYRGARDIRMAYLGQFAGRNLDKEGEFSESILSLEESQVIQATGTVVFLINAFSLFPVLKIVKEADATARSLKLGKAVKPPTIKEYVLLPVTDSAGSVIETSAAPLAYLLIVSKGLELFSDEFAAMIAEIQVNWP